MKLLVLTLAVFLVGLGVARAQDDTENQSPFLGIKGVATGFEPMQWQDNIYLTATSIANPARLERVAVVNTFDPVAVASEQGWEAISNLLASGQAGLAINTSENYDIVSWSDVCTVIDQCNGPTPTTTELQVLAGSGDAVLVGTDAVLLGVPATNKIINWSWNPTGR